MEQPPGKALLCDGGATPSTCSECEGLAVHSEASHSAALVWGWASSQEVQGADPTPVTVALLLYRRSKLALNAEQRLRPACVELRTLSS